MTNAMEGNVMSDQIDSLDPDTNKPNHQIMDTDSVLQNTLENLNKTSKEIESLKNLILNEPEINKTKVNFIKKELESGRYEINNKSIAEKMFPFIELASLIS